MKDAINTYLRSVKNLNHKVTDSELNYLKRGVTIAELKNKHFYIHANTVQRELGFVYQGLLRSFYIDKNGNEISVNFIKENEYATDYTAFISETPSRYYFQCIEPTIIFNLSLKHIQNGYEEFPGLERFGRLVVEEVLGIQQKRIDGFLFDSAEKRYLDFIEENPDLVNRVSLSVLSSYLGIERQSLTRIRNKLAKK